MSSSTGLTEFERLRSEKNRLIQSGNNKGTIRSDMRSLVVPMSVRRRRLVSIDYITALPLSRQRSRVRVSSSPPYFQSLTENPEKNLGPFGSNKPRSSPRAAHSPERIQERTPQYQLLNQS